MTLVPSGTDTPHDPLLLFREGRGRPCVVPHLEGGVYYEAWLKNAAGVLVPIGTFNDAREVTLWSGVPVTQFRTLSVTRQRAGQGPASSGVRVLLGTIRAGR